jgi:hypothetical protein
MEVEEWSPQRTSQREEGVASTGLERWYTARLFGTNSLKEQCGVAPKSLIIECPLLDNGSIATNPAPFSGEQLNTFNWQRIYNRPLHGNAAIVSKTEPLSKVSPRPSECGIYQRETTRTETVTMRVIGGDEKWSLESETVKYGHESYGTRTRKWLRWRGPAAVVNDRPVLASERAPHINNPTTVRQWQRSGRKPQMGALFQDRPAGWPSVVT